MEDKDNRSMDSFIANHNRSFMREMVQQSADDEVFVGKELNVTVRSIGSKGDGIARYKSFLVFVPDTKVNDSVSVVVNGVKDNLVFANRKK